MKSKTKLNANQNTDLVLIDIQRDPLIKGVTVSIPSDLATVFKSEISKILADRARVDKNGVVSFHFSYYFERARIISDTPIYPEIIKVIEGNENLDSDGRYYVALSIYLSLVQLGIMVNLKNRAREIIKSKGNVS